MSTRFARVVEQCVKKYKTPGIKKVTFTPGAVIELLQREHWAVADKVRKMPKHGPNFHGGMVPCKQGEWINVNDLLAWLRERGT